MQNKPELKPFDKVLVRDNNTDVWQIELFESDKTAFWSMVMLVLHRHAAQPMPMQPVHTGTTSVCTLTNVVRHYDTLYIPLPAEAQSTQTLDTTSHLRTTYAISNAAILPDGSLRHTLRQLPLPVKVVTHTDTVYRNINRQQTDTLTRYIQQPASPAKQFVRENGKLIISGAILITILYLGLKVSQATK